MASNERARHKKITSHTIIDVKESEKEKTLEEDEIEAHDEGSAELESPFIV